MARYTICKKIVDNFLFCVPFSCRILNNNITVKHRRQSTILNNWALKTTEWQDPSGKARHFSLPCLTVTAGLRKHQRGLKILQEMRRCRLISYIYTSLILFIKYLSILDTNLPSRSSHPHPGLQPRGRPWFQLLLVHEPL